MPADHAIEHGLIRIEAIDFDVAQEVAALARFDGRPAFRGRGEAEVVALATARNYIVGSDEVAVRRIVAAELGHDRIATSLDMLVWAVRQDRLDIAEAEQVLDRLDVGPGIRRELGRRARTLSDLV